MKLFAILCLPLALFQCTPEAKKPDMKAPVVVGGGNAANALNTAAVGADVKNKEAEEQRAKQLSKVGAEIKASQYITSTISAPEDLNAKTALTAALAQAELELGAKIDPRDAEEALARALLNIQGKYEEAAAKYAEASNAATAARIERDAALNARDAALSELPKLVDAHKKELETNRQNAQKIADALTKQINEERIAAAARLEEELDKERKKMGRMLSYVLLGMGAAGFLVAIGTMYLTKGLQWERAAIAAGGGAACLTMYWTLNQPWFKYVVWGTISASVLAVIWWVMSERKDANARNQLKSDAETLAEKEALLRSTATKVIARVDGLKDRIPVEVRAEFLAGLRGDMNVEERDIVHALRFENATSVPATTKA